MNFSCRLVVSTLLGVVIAFCLFGFLATFEPLPASVQNAWRATYSVVGLGGLACLAYVWRARRK